MLNWYDKSQVCLNELDQDRNRFGDAEGKVDKDQLETL